MNRSFVVIAVQILLASTALAAPAHKKPEPPMFDAVSAAADKACAARKGYSPGEIISQGDWDTLAKELDSLGWTPKDAAEIKKQLLPDNAFLVTELRTKPGRKFMADMDKLPGGYDRLDRLSTLPQGKSTVRRLIAGPDGYKLVEYMTTTSGGQVLGKQLSGGSRDFNSPTGRIYTADQLIARLKTSYNRDFPPPAKPRSK